ncbi:glycosyltransferase family 2 protein [Fuscovulum ytuae]|uniref:Glycosyltransferase family 2 protein n=1 Tax=Fuscovulum ytuae TaxID=3042299 RepID=A0ABY8Q4Y9_9RHOB|nr:glycosyltransferase family 2 protein [Fuscovulum sp. YMD61]WGV15935.1 glycosyltransferase family 2 protein [Fuscovulum sp. YMD61]
MNYGTAELALAAAASVLEQAVLPPALHLHIVDNASPGDDAQTIEKEITARGWQDRVTLWAETVNHGFGRGNNLVLCALSDQPTSPDYVLLLNPDAILEQSALATMAALLDARPDVVGVGAGISTPDGRPVTAAFRFPSVLGEFESAASFGPVSRILHKHRIPLSPDHPEGPVDWVSGAAVLFRFTSLQQIGFFDPGFFLYFEEVDLMRRLRERGDVIWYLPSARVRHVEGAATGVKPGTKRRKPAYWFRSWSLYHRRAGTFPRALAAATAHVSGITLNLLQASLRRVESVHPRYYLRDFVIGVFPALLWARQAFND